MPTAAFNAMTVLESLAEGRRGLDVFDAEPLCQSGVIPEPPEADITLEQTQWSRGDFNDVSDDSQACNQSTRATPEAFEAISS